MAVEQDDTDESKANDVMPWPDVPRLAFAPGLFGEDLDADLAWARSRPRDMYGYVEGSGGPPSH